MANADAVGQEFQDGFGFKRLAWAVPVSVGAVANAAAVMPLLSGGLQGTGQVIVRRITVSNAANAAGGAVQSCAGVYVSISTDSAGTSNITTNAAVSNVTSNIGYQDLTLIASTYANTITSNALFVNVTAGAVANHTVRVTVYGDVVTF